LLPARRLSVLALAALLVLALNRFYFPSRFRIDDEGITARYTLRRQRCRWSEVRRFRHDERGAWLTPRSRPSRLDAYRGMHILFGRHREEVIERIRRCLTRERASEAD
ncbi:MAG: PH domain-containing protein, partial [Planctomycetota bacterium]